MIENIMKKKHFILNCDICDTRKIGEDAFVGYDSVIINTHIIIQNDISKKIFEKNSMILNYDTVIDSDRKIIHKKDMSITADTVIDEDKIYIISGKLNIEKNSEDVLAKIHKAYVIGSAQYPKSVADILTNFTFIGDTLIFPDDSVIMDNTKIIDDIFEITAKENTLYYAKNKIVISKIDIDAILSKNIKFETKKLVLDKALFRKALPLFNPDIELVLLPENCSYHSGNATLDSAFRKKYGANVYIDGHLTVNGDSDLTNVEYLFVNGDVYILERLKDEFIKLNAVYNNINFIKGKFLGNCGSVTVDKFILESNLDGVSIENFGNAHISEDVTPKLILERLSMLNGGNVSCSEEQISAVQMITSNVGNIAVSKKSDGNPLKEIMEALSNKIVNADYYVF